MFGLGKRGKGGKVPVRNKGRSAKSSGKRTQTQIRTARKLFHGVSIHPDELSACAAARELESIRFLADDAPMLPLRDCTNPAGCRCKYQHYDDRRTEARRESDVGLPVKDHPAEARTGVGRRVTDG